jgi:hypothetical protein
MKRFGSVLERGSVTRSNQLVARGSRTAEGNVERWSLLRLTEPRSAASSFRLLAIFAMVILGPMLFTGCESTGGSVSGGVYYGAGFYDPWYHGGYYYDDPDIIVTPPSNRPEPPPRPTHPIAPTPSPRPTPLPSIPSAPRASFRR